MNTIKALRESLETGKYIYKIKPMRHRK